MKELEIDPQMALEVENLLQLNLQANKQPFWETQEAEEIFVPVEDGEIRVFHHKPLNPISKRPIVFVPGWGALLDSFRDFYEIIFHRAEFFHIETREKISSRLHRRRARMDMNQKARDLRDVIRNLGIDQRPDYLLFGTCWGSAIILQGLIDRILASPTVIAFDPMHTLWFPKWLLNWVVPFTTISMANLIRPLAKRITLSGMTEEVQRKRTGRFIDNAEIWKWKRAALHTKNFELFGNLHRVLQEVFVCNGTRDKIHDNSHYPKIAMEIPKGRFLYMKTDESKRERLMGIVALEFAKIRQENGLPPLFQRFEKILQRQNSFSFQ